MKHYIDENNVYLGGWDFEVPPNSREVPFPPEDARQLWLGDSWGPIPKDKPSLLQENNNAYSNATHALTADYPQLEKDTWPTQDEEVKSWVADPAGAVTPWIDRAATERNLDREEYLRRTLVKSKQFKVLSAFLTGRRQRYEDQIKAHQTPVCDYALTQDVVVELAQIANEGMSRPTEELGEVF